MKILYFIPARGGSKGIPHKNIKLLAGKPLICYSIDIARQLASDEDICVSTDDYEIKQVVEEYGLKIPFMRPSSLATDTCGTYEVIIHALAYYKSKGINYDVLVLLQPTSPLRTVQDVKDAISLYSVDIDMVVGVKEVSTNPYYNCFKEDKDGFLIPILDNNLTRRQDAPKLWEYNGAVYVMTVKSLREKSIASFEKNRMHVMDSIHSIDLDTQMDWDIAEMLLMKHLEL